jgi:uncharacterized protein
MNKEKLRLIMSDQREFFLKDKEFIKRDIDLSKLLKTRQIVLISGIRRCGKSTLLQLINKELKKDFLYFNFDDERIIDFSLDDFNVLFELFLESNPKDFVFYFDEIQVVQGWEKFLNRMYENGVKIFVTGSNAKLLSSEIATALTGRNLVVHLSPFSFKEFLRFKNIKKEYDSTSKKASLKRAFKQYFSLGGFPLVVQENDSSLIKQYYSDIFYRDIISRYNLQNVEELKVLATYLLSGVGRSISYSKMAEVGGISSKSLVKKYLEYFLNSFLFIEIKKFDYSYKKQILNPRKFYSIDLGFLKEVGFNFSENHGKILENLVLIHLKSRGREVYYYKKKGECDFVIKEGLKIKEAMQVCYNLNEENEKREINGLVNACKEYKLNEGLLLTYDQEKEIKQDYIKIKIKPVWKWLLE